MFLACALFANNFQDDYVPRYDEIHDEDRSRDLGGGWDSASLGFSFGLTIVSGLLGVAATVVAVMIIRRQ